MVVRPTLCVERAALQAYMRIANNFHVAPGLAGSNIVTITFVVAAAAAKFCGSIHCKLVNTHSNDRSDIN